MSFGDGDGGGQTVESPEAALAIPAEKVFVSYSHERQNRTDPWMRQVRAFVALLRANGIDADCDQYDEGHLNRTWDIWGRQAVEDADTIVSLAVAPTKERLDETARIGRV